jgi:hypothetical protein
MTHFFLIHTQTIVPDTQDAADGTMPEQPPPLPADVVPPEIERELPPHTEVRLVYWLRRDYWTRLITPIVGTLEERDTQ